MQIREVPTFVQTNDVFISCGVIAQIPYGNKVFDVNLHPE
jgi:hypothetical protein